MDSDHHSKAVGRSGSCSRWRPKRWSQMGEVCTGLSHSSPGCNGQPTYLLTCRSSAPRYTLSIRLQVNECLFWIGIARNYCTILYIIVRGHFKTSTGVALTWLSTTSETTGGIWDKNPSPWRARECQNAVATHDSDPSDWPVARSPAEQNMSRKGSSFIRCNSQKKTDSSNYKSHSLFIVFISCNVLCLGEPNGFWFVYRRNWRNPTTAQREVASVSLEPSDTTPNFLWHQNDQNGGCCVFGVFPKGDVLVLVPILPGISWVTCPASASFKVVRQLLAKSADPPRSHGMPAMSDSVRRCPTVRRGWSRSIPCRANV